MTEADFVCISGIVKPGHQVASGQAADSPYERGTLEMQLPYFRTLGLDLSGFYLGTLNVLIAPYTFELIRPQYTFEQLKWHPNYPAETFSFSPAVLILRNYSYSSWIYYPHPETKIGHFQDDSIMEIIAPRIVDLGYGDRLSLKIDPQKVRLTDVTH